MSETHRIEIVFDDARWTAVEDEAARLGLDIPQLVTRATCAWLSESADTAALLGVGVASVASAQ
jgi:hypothetical protein